MAKHPIALIVNGVITLADCRADTTVLQWLRTSQRLTGTKEGCAEGDCGACTVLVSNQDGSGYQSANACILSMGQVAGRSLITVEGLSQETVHPLQSAMAQNGSSQCGFCTPGIVVSLAGLLASRANPSEHEIHDALAGNLCRCTGYRPIVEAAKKTAASGLHFIKPHAPLPVEKVNEALAVGSQFFRPQSLAELFEIRKQYPAAVLLAGGTDLGLSLAEHEAHWAATIWTGAVKELRTIGEDCAAWHFGAAVTWSEMLDALGDQLPSLSVLLRRFGSVQIRNLGTIGGNIGTASPIGDGPPSLIALGAIIHLASERGTRSLALEDFFLDYRKTALQPDEIIAEITLPKPKSGQHFRVWKVSKRYDQDISTVCGAFNLTIEHGNITSARVAFGGMAATPRRAPLAESALVGLSVANGDFAAVASAIRASFSPLSDWRGSAQYRTEVAANLGLRLAADLRGELVEVMELERTL